MRRVALAFTVVILAGVTVGGQRPAVVIENPPNSSAIFTCGVDQVLPNPIPLRATQLILAGDGRLYVPCPGADMRDGHGLTHREVREENVLARGLMSLVPLERFRAAQALARMPRLQSMQITQFGGTGRPMTAAMDLTDNLGGLVNSPAITPACSATPQLFGSAVSPVRWQPGRLFQLLADPSIEVQREMAYAIGTRLSVAGKEADLYTAAFNELRVCAIRGQVKTTDEVRGLLLEAIGLAAYPNQEQRDAAEEFLVQQADGSIDRLLGALRGLEALIRGNARRPITNATRSRLRELAFYGMQAQSTNYDPNTTVRMLAVQSLATAGETDILYLRRVTADADWQVRRLIASRLDPSNTDQAAIIEILQRDPAFQVRYDLVSAISRFALRTATCGPLVPYLEDQSPAVVMRALDVLPAKCTDLAEVLPKVVKMAEQLEGATEQQGSMSWHIPSRALTALSRLKPEAAKPWLAPAVKNSVWQVRAAAVGVALALQEVTMVRELAAGDAHANVRTAALDGLSRAKQQEVFELAIGALQNATDFQLLMTAARVLRGVSGELRENATFALLGALRRLTDAADDMSRDPRVAILERLGETLPKERAGDLLTYAADFDDAVCEAASKAFTSLVGSPPNDTGKRRRYPAQVLEAELNPGALPAAATITLDTGKVVLVFHPDVAPVTVAWFQRLVRSGAYNGKTLHRVVPNFVVQGGSPGANEYSGVTGRFLRDEVGPQVRHRRGAVGISTRGPDTGDGQLFIDLVDSPRLDHAYTVFAYVASGMEYIDALLEGAVIRSIILGPAR